MASSDLGVRFFECPHDRRVGLRETKKKRQAFAVSERDRGRDGEKTKSRIKLVLATYADTHLLHRHNSERGKNNIKASSRMV